MLGHAAESYENGDEELAAFEARAMEQPADLAMLRLLMAQHNLGTGDLPEIGSKSMDSRVRLLDPEWMVFSQNLKNSL